MAIDIGLHCAAVARLNVRHSFADRDHFHAQFMSRDARITVERHLAQEAGIIGPANSDAMHPDESLAWPRRTRLGEVEAAELLRLFQLESFHDLIIFRQPLHMPDVFHRLENLHHLGQQLSVERFGGPCGPFLDVLRVG